MTRFPESVRPDAIRQSLEALRRRVDSASAAVSTTVVTGWTDAIARTIIVTKTFTDFADPGSTIDVVLLNLPAGATITHIRIEPITPFTGGAIGAVTGEVLVPANGAIMDGAAKTPVDLFTPAGIAAQGAALYIASDPAAAQDLELELAITGGVGTDLTAGECRVHLSLSIPGTTTDTLPHA